MKQIKTIVEQYTDDFDKNAANRYKGIDPTKSD